MHLAPVQVWAMDPQDFATVIALLGGADDEEEVDPWLQAFE